jgi:hypothetical protein
MENMDKTMSPLILDGYCFRSRRRARRRGRSLEHHLIGWIIEVIGMRPLRPREEMPIDSRSGLGDLFPVWLVIVVCITPYVPGRPGRALWAYFALLGRALPGFSPSTDFFCQTGKKILLVEIR